MQKTLVLARLAVTAEKSAATSAGHRRATLGSRRRTETQRPLLAPCCPPPAPSPWQPLPPAPCLPPKPCRPTLLNPFPWGALSRQGLLACLHLCLMLVVVPTALLPHLTQEPTRVHGDQCPLLWTRGAAQGSERTDTTSFPCTGTAQEPRACSGGSFLLQIPWNKTGLAGHAISATGRGCSWSDHN